MPSNVVLSDFVSSVPSPLTFGLVSLADNISFLKSALQLLSWRSSSPFDAWLALAAWWALCLFATSVLRLFLPIVILVGVLVQRRRSSATSSSRQPLVTETLLQNTISDLALLPVLLPSPPPLSLLASLPLPSLLRTLAILYVPYLLLTSFIPLRLIFAIAGTLVLTWRAPFALVLRRTLWRSAFVRWLVFTSWARISGQPLPPKSVSPQTLQLAAAEKASSSSATSPAPTSTSLRFLFTIHENQRWWMGLDWTAALLPGERPSWCSASQAPLSPPNAFTLPEPTTVYLPHPDGSHKKVKRTAEWYWEEPEWRVLVRREGGNLSRVERPLPSNSPEKDEVGVNTANNTGSRLFKAASSRFSSGTAGSSSSAPASTHQRDSSWSHHEEPDAQDTESTDPDAEPYTDPDGWVYGDNKWENPSNRGGISKYTRHRRWTRVAVLTEFAQVVDAIPENTPDRRTKTHPGHRSPPPPLPLGLADKEETHAPPSAPVSPPTQEQPLPTAPLTATSARTSSSDHPIASSPPSGNQLDSPLRQRLRNALNKGASMHQT